MHNSGRTKSYTMPHNNSVGAGTGATLKQGAPSVRTATTGSSPRSMAKTAPVVGKVPKGRY